MIAGEGYSLRVLPQRNCTIQAVTSEIQSVLPDSALTPGNREELIYNIPSDTSKFAELLEHLHRRKEYLKIDYVGLSITTMEQVFLRYVSNTQHFPK